MTWASAENALRSFERGSVSYYPSRTPLAFPQSVLALGLLLLTLALLARAIRLALDEPPEAGPAAPRPGGRRDGRARGDRAVSAPLAVISVMLALTLAGGVWVGFALLATGWISLELFVNMRVERFLAGDLWGTATAIELVTLPLFILMGEILFHTRLSENLFAGLAPFVRRLPGRLMHVNVLGCTLFAAVSGSSAATTATVGRITLKELEARGYDKVFAAGALAGSGTMGFLIPPSIPLIVYGVLAEVSILDLFVAGIGPGLI